MHRLLLITLFLLCTFLPRPYVEAKQGRATLPVDAHGEESNLAFLNNLKETLEKAGFKDVQLVPEIFVATALGSDGKRSTLLVNADTMQAMELEGTSEFVSKGSQQTTTPSK